MKRVSIALLIIVALLSVVSHATRSESFSREQLSPKGQRAYDKLFSACIFRVGGVGYSGETSTEELALYDVLEEGQAIEALKSLVASGTYEGGLYGLLGLSIKNHAEFNKSVEVYKARKVRPECQTTDFFHRFRADGEMVTTQGGCIIMTESRDTIVTSIQSGRFDNSLMPKYRPLK